MLNTKPVRTGSPLMVRARCTDCEYRNFCGDVFERLRRGLKHSAPRSDGDNLIEAGAPGAKRETDRASLNWWSVRRESLSQYVSGRQFLQKMFPGQDA